MLDAAERAQVIGRIAESLARFDDETLREMERLVDPGTYAEGETARGRLSSPLGLTRRQLITGLVAGGGLVTVAAAGTALTLRPDGPVRAEVARLRELVALYQRLEDVGLAGALRTALGTLAAAVAAARRAAETLSAGLDLVEGVLSAAIPGIDSTFPSILRQNVIDPARDLIAGLGGLAETWQAQLQSPLEAKLGECDSLREQIATLRATVGDRL
jgi:hypothetical protein